jgi:hypothetical protein
MEHMELVSADLEPNFKSNNQFSATTVTPSPSRIKTTQQSNTNKKFLRPRQNDSLYKITIKVETDTTFMLAIQHIDSKR